MISVTYSIVVHCRDWVQSVNISYHTLVLLINLREYFTILELQNGGRNVWEMRCFAMGTDFYSVSRAFESKYDHDWLNDLFYRHIFWILKSNFFKYYSMFKG